MTGQNPRKGEHPERFKDLLNELSDVIWTGIAALQHFTKDTELTAYIINKRGEELLSRVPEDYKCHSSNG